MPGGSCAGTRTSDVYLEVVIVVYRYNLDFMSLAVVNLVLSLLGLPWVHGALPFSPMHAQALADATETQRHGAIARTVVIARETRLSNLIAHVLILLLVGARPLLEAIPTAVLYGFFLFVGVSALGDNSMWTRMELFVVEPTKYPSNHYMRFVPMKDLHLFTAVQLAVFAVLWMVKAGFYVETSFPISLLFPFVLALVVPFRIHVLPKLFKDGDIRAILAGEEAEQSVFA
jgi:sodium borate transporter 11